MSSALDVTRGEFTLLKEVVDRTQIRLDVIDDHGTRGVIAVQAQLLDLVKDVSDLNNRFEQDRKERISGRRWLIGMGIAGLGSMAAILTVVLEILVQHAHP